MIKYDLLVYLGLIPLVAVMIFAGFVIWKTPTDTDLETRKLRIADAVLVGLLALFIFTAILYFVDAEGAGEEISTKLLQSFLLWWARSLATFLVPEQNSEPRKEVGCHSKNNRPTA